MKIAIDVAFLPPPEIWEKAVSLSQKINAGNPQPLIQLDETHFPHITLAQACIKYDDLNKITALVERAIDSISPIELFAERIIKDEGDVSSLEIQQNKTLIRLHKALLKGATGFQQKVSPDALYAPDGGSISQSTIEYISSFQKLTPYWPHITLAKSVSPIPLGRQQHFPLTALPFVS